MFAETYLRQYYFPTSMTEIITVGEKGQVVIPKKFRDELKLVKGTKLLVVEEKDKITLKPVRLEDKHALLLLSEASLRNVWDNKHDQRWDDVL